jgi:hypothetical protein
VEVTVRLARSPVSPSRIAPLLIEPSEVPAAWQSRIHFEESSFLRRDWVAQARRKNEEGG